MDEVYYGDLDSDGNPIDDEKLGYLTTDGIVNLRMVEKAQKVCRRPSHPFHSNKDKRKWMRIDTQFTAGKIPRRWIDFCFEWVSEKNKIRTIITMDKLANLILNKARMTDYLSKNPDPTEIGPVIDMGNIAGRMVNMDE